MGLGRLWMGLGLWMGRMRMLRIWMERRMLFSMF
jgi:hypothetical protein